MAWQAKKDDRPRDAENYWMEVIDLDDRIVELDDTMADLYPSSTPYLKAATLRRQRGDTEAEVEVLERYKAAVTSGLGSREPDTYLLRRLKLRRDRRF